MHRIAGPAIIEQPDGVIVLPPGAVAVADRYHNVMITTSTRRRRHDRVSDQARPAPGSDHVRGPAPLVRVRARAHEPGPPEGVVLSDHLRHGRLLQRDLRSRRRADRPDRELPGAYRGDALLGAPRRCERFPRRAAAAGRHRGPQRSLPGRHPHARRDDDDAGVPRGRAAGDRGQPRPLDRRRRQPRHPHRRRGPAAAAADALQRRQAQRRARLDHQELHPHAPVRRGRHPGPDRRAPGGARRDASGWPTSTAPTSSRRACARCSTTPSG